MLTSKFRNTVGDPWLQFRQGRNILSNFNSYLYVNTTEAIFVDTFSHLESVNFYRHFQVHIIISLFMPLRHVGRGSKYPLIPKFDNGWKRPASYTSGQFTPEKNPLILTDIFSTFLLFAFSKSQISCSKSSLPKFTLCHYVTDSFPTGIGSLLSAEIKLG